MTRQEMLEQEMDDNLNPLIPHGKAAREVEKTMIANDSTHEGVLKREMIDNPLVPGTGFKTLPPGAAGDYVWREALGKWVRVR